MVCQTWCVTKWCVKDGVSKVVCDKVVCERWCVTKCHTASPVPQEPCLPRDTKVDVTKCHTCHAKYSTAHGATKARPSVPSDPAQCPKCHACRAKRKWMSASATPATQNEGGCHQVPRVRLPRKTKVDVAKCHTCHACHAKWCGAPGDQSAPKRATRPSPVPQVPRLRKEGGCQQVSRLPRKTKVDVTKCHAYACHTKRRWMSPSATVATQNEGGCHQVAHLLRKVPRRRGRTKRAQARHQTQPSACPKCQTCHAKPRWMSPSVTPATPVAQSTAESCL